MGIVTPLDPLGLTRHPTCHPQTGCVRSAAQYTPTHHPSPSIHTGWVVASGNRTPNLTFNTSGTPVGTPTGSICWCARGVKGQVGGLIPTGNNPPSMNGRRRVRGWDALGCSNLTASGARGGVRQGCYRYTCELEKGSN